MSKRLIALLLALVLCVGMLAACGGNGDDETTKGTEETTKGTEETTAGTEPEYVRPDMTGVKITQIMPNNKDYDPEGSYVNLAVEKLLGLDLEIYEDETGNAVTNMLAEGKAPELQWKNSFGTADFQNIEDGAFINVLDYLDKMPNVKAWLELPENADHVAKYTNEDGTVLGAIPVIQVGGNAGKYAFLYRKDVFEANNLKFPTNQEEFVQTLRDLKKLYPDSNPFIMRNMTGNYQGAQAFGHLWGGTHILNGEFGTMFTLGDDGKYYLGQTSQAYKEMGKFFYDLMEEGLMNKSSMTVDTTAWTSAIASNQSFITYDKVDRLPSMQVAMADVSTDYQMAAAAPFNFGTYAKTATKVATGYSGASTGYCYMIGNTENLDNVLTYLDWLFSDEAYVLTNWGVEGESYEVNADGTKSFKEGFLEKYHESNGLVVSGLWAVAQSGRTDFDAYLASSEDWIIEALDIAAPTEGGGQMQKYLRYTADENVTYTTYQKDAYNYALGEFAKFVTGQRDWAEWDKVVEELKSGYHYDELLKIHEDALARLEG